MSLVRGEAEAVEVARRFRRDADHFACWREGDWWVLRTDAPAERTAELFHELSAELPGTVALSLVRVRDGQGWEGRDLALADVREEVARLRAPVARTGGLVVTAWGDDRQLALSAQLSTWAWARTPTWRTAAGRAGLVERPRAQLGDRRWASRPAELPGSRELDAVVASIVGRLGLAPVAAPRTA